ncbi:uncharacterized protein [Chelonus insularis]|uniref:uncharacterized protein n=1 Tax=Chelonus insularis TaxID=460826 RepID=UPI00158ED91C|nr:uncharacterized protein LOC118064064 [Chelonus insularis]
MFFQEDINSVCMIFDTFNYKLNNQFIQKAEISFEKTKILTKRQLEELLFDICTDCCKMAAVPQGAFAVCKFQERMDHQVLSMKSKLNDDRGYNNNSGGSFRKNLFEECEPTPMKYSSKLMNSIWGLYNRYSVHNFKKNTDANGNILTAALGSVLLSNTSPNAASTTSVTEVTVKPHVG